MNLKNQQLIINGVFQAVDPTDEVFYGFDTLDFEKPQAMDLVKVINDKKDFFKALVTSH